MANRFNRKTSLDIKVSLDIYSIPKNKATIVNIITILPSTIDKLSKQNTKLDVIISIVKNHRPKSINKKEPEIKLIHNIKKLFIKNIIKQEIEE